MKYNKNIQARIFHHGFDRSKLPAGCVILKSKTKILKNLRLVMDTHEYEQCLVKFPDGHVEWMFIPILDPEKEDIMEDEEFKRYIEYRPFPGTTLTSDSMSVLAYMRYGLSVPTNRLAVMLDEAGLGGCRQTVINWLQNGAGKLSYLLPSLKKKLLSKDAVVNCDETWERLRLEYRTGYKKVYVWCMVNRKEKVVYYFYDRPEDGTRSREVLKQFMGDAKVKALQSDGYVGYVFLDDDLVDVDHIYCLAHVRAKLFYAYDIAKVEEAKVFLELIRRLYDLERHYKVLGLTPNEIKIRRNNKETNDIIQALRKELDSYWPSKKGTLDPMFETALRYLYNQWDGLMNYRKDGEYSIDNNIAERNIRPTTVERKNSLSFGSEEGIERSATYHTIIQTCRMMGVKVLKYFEAVFKKLAEGCQDYSSLIPGTLVID